MEEMDQYEYYDWIEEAGWLADSYPRDEQQQKAQAWLDGEAKR